MIGWDYMNQGTKKAPNRCALLIMDNHILTQKKNLLVVLFRIVPTLLLYKK